MEIPTHEAKYRFLLEELSNMALEYANRTAELKTRQLVELQTMRGKLAEAEARIRELEEFQNVIQEKRVDGTDLSDGVHEPESEQ